MAASSVFRPLPLTPRSPALVFPRRSYRPSYLQQQRGSLPRVNTRNASTAESAAVASVETVKRTGNSFKKFVCRTAIAVTLLGGYLYVTDTRASIHRYGVVPIIRWLYPDAEDAHHVGVVALRKLYNLGLYPRERGNPDSDGKLATEV
jgi:dihydroorotate dehydrogenase